jgi:hypothetical protein
MHSSRVSLLIVCATALSSCHSDYVFDPANPDLGGRWVLTVGPLGDNGGFTCTYHLAAVLRQTGDSVAGPLEDIGSSCEDQGTSYAIDLPDSMRLVGVVQDSSLFGNFGGAHSNKTILARMGADTFSGISQWIHDAPDTTELVLHGSVRGTHD